MSKLCNHCECTTINGVRCHERGCVNEKERIFLGDDGSMDTVFYCLECDEEMRFTYDPSEEPEDPEEAYDDFVYWALRDAQDEHECETEDDQT